MSANALSSPLEEQPHTGVPDSLAVRFFFLVSAGLAVASLPRLFEVGKLSGSAIGPYSIRWAGLLAVFTVLALLNVTIFALLLTGARGRMAGWYARLHSLLARLGPANLAAVVVLWGAYIGMVLYRFHKSPLGLIPQLWLFWLVVGGGAVFVLARWRKISFFQALLAVTVLYGFGVRALGYLPDINSFPFSLGWSEGSRYYYGSLPLARMLYGAEIPLSPWHPSRYLLLSLPFLIPDSSLLFSRVWQVFLWLALPVATGLALGRRFAIKGAFAWLVALWAALFLLQGPVYYHLLVCVIVILLGFDRRRFWRSLVVVAIASLWAGISRVNWIPVPAFLAAAIYLMERPVCETRGLNTARGWLDYFWQPAAWGIVGCGVGLAAQSLYMLVSGHTDTSVFQSSFTSALLWYRLLPNPTNRIGVLPTILLLTAPALALLVGNLVRKGREWHALRVLPLLAMVLVLFAGGLVVSTKIGGGSNIHNMDAYLVILLVISVTIWMDRFSSETGQAIGVRPLWRPWLLTVLLMAVPVIWNMQIGDPFATRNMDQASFDLSKLNATVQKHAGEGDILFITQRHLQVFRMTPGVQFVPDYELLTLSEMSISGNRTYLDRFYSDLRKHRFALIVADRQSSTIKDPSRDSFAEENNAWVANISEYLMQYYESELFLETQGVDMLVPRQ